MQPIGPLMIEHRLIEKVVSLMEHELKYIQATSTIDPHFVELVVDFFRTYADRTHHGKEEDILFRELAKKPLSPEHQKTMKELMQEHVVARTNVGGLVSTNQDFLHGDTGALKMMTVFMGVLVHLYPAHIEKEDKHFFVPVMQYFSQDEQDAMLKEFWDFDRKLIHEKYQKAFEELKGIAK